MTLSPVLTVPTAPWSALTVLLPPEELYRFDCETDDGGVFGLLEKCSYPQITTVDKIITITTKVFLFKVNNKAQYFIKVPIRYASIVSVFIKA